MSKPIEITETIKRTAQVEYASIATITIQANQEIASDKFVTLIDIDYDLLDPDRNMVTSKVMNHVFESATRNTVERLAELTVQYVREDNLELSGNQQ